MAEASIPVDPFNPGQVFACLGFLETAEKLANGSKGGFEWKTDGTACFMLCTDGADNPFAAVLESLGDSMIRSSAPLGFVDRKTPKEKIANNAISSEQGQELILSDCFPDSSADPKTLPVRLVHANYHIDLSSWCDGSTRGSFKLYAGQQSGVGIVRAMLLGSDKDRTKGLAALWRQNSTDLSMDPFGVLTPMAGSSFKFDARKAWTGMDAGYSPDEQGHRVAASPVVELLAAIGLENARPRLVAKGEYQYGVWQDLLPVQLARPALAGAELGLQVKRYAFRLAMAGRNKNITFGHEVRAS